MALYRVTNFDEGLETIMRGIQKLEFFVDSNGVNRENGNIELFSVTERMSIYGVVFNLCSLKEGKVYREELYCRYEAFFRRYINFKVLPAMRGKSGELLLREVVKRWQDYKFIVRWMTTFFLHLDHLFTRIRDDRRMRNTALLILHNLAYEEMKGQIISTVLSMIDADRDGHSVDRALVKEVLEIVYDLQSETINAAYWTDFELALLDSSGAYYLNKMAYWHQNLPYPEYMSKVVECMTAENLRAMQYLHSSTVQKLLERIKSILHPKLDRIDGNNLASKVQQLKL